MARTYRSAPRRQVNWVQEAFLASGVTPPDYNVSALPISPLASYGVADENVTLTRARGFLKVNAATAPTGPQTLILALGVFSSAITTQFPTYAESNDGSFFWFNEAPIIAPSVQTGTNQVSYYNIDCKAQRKLKTNDVILLVCWHNGTGTYPNIDVGGSIRFLLKD